VSPAGAYSLLPSTLKHRSHASVSLYSPLFGSAFPSECAGTFTFVAAFPFWASPMDLFVLRLRTLPFSCCSLFFFFHLSLFRLGSPRRHRHHLSRPSSLPSIGTVLIPTSLGLDSSSLPASPPLIVTTPLLAYAMAPPGLRSSPYYLLSPAPGPQIFFGFFGLGFFGFVVASWETLGSAPRAGASARRGGG
jgi:hypothetical protein